MNMSALNTPIALTINDVQNTLIILLETSLILGMIWLMFKKSNNYYSQHLNSSKTEEDNIIKVYKPENLVEEVSVNHCKLNNTIVRGKIGLSININGRTCINFGTHDYFGLIGNSHIETTAIKCVDTYGVGACGPRGFYGTTIEHLELEQLLADIFNAESSIAYSNGFATLASAIPAYAKKTDIIFVDECRNFAIQKGLDVSKSEIKYFKHNDAKNLKSLLESQHELDLLDKRKARSIRRYLIIEGIYINTGTICPLPELLKLCKKYKVRVFVDESVSFGVLGTTGKGVTEYFGVSSAEVDLIMGSFEYALASVGGFCVGSRLLIDHQQVSGLGYCFSASLPPLLAAAVIEALQIFQNDQDSVLKLNKLCQFMHYKLNNSAIICKHFTISGDADSPVHLMAIKHDAHHSIKNCDAIIDALLAHCTSMNVALTRAAGLQDDSAGPKGAIRITTHLLHTEGHILHLIKVLEEACNYLFCENTICDKS